MSFFGGAGRGTTMTPRPPGRPDAKSILPVGSRAIVVQESPGEDVPLSDEPGHTRVGSVPAGVEVELTAWRPRGGWATRYRIRLDDGREGWVDASNLRARPEPEPARRAPAAAAPEAPKKKATKAKRARPSRASS